MAATLETTALRARRRPHDLDVEAAVTRWRRIGAALPGTAVHYAVAADPDPALLAALAAAGSGFEVAGPAEVVAALRAGAAASELVCATPVQRGEDIAFAARLGVRLFVVGSAQETRTVAAAAPRSAVLCRIAPSGDGPDGRSSARATTVLRCAAAVGLDPAGVCFHLGPRQRDPQAWDAPVAAASRVFSALRAAGLAPWLLDLGGGLPAHGEAGCPPLACYGAAIERSLRHHFGRQRPHTLVEPGRAVAAGAGTPGRPATARSGLGSLSGPGPARGGRPARPHARWWCAAAPHG